MEEQSKKITYESLWKAIIRPPRDYYTDEDMGPTYFQFHGKYYTRKDFDLIDFRGLILKVSIVEPDPISRPFDIMPCVIYVHANSSSRSEGMRIKNCLLKKNINICSFDFEGSGYSEGEYISLGYHEKKQLKNVVDFLENYPGVGEIGLWGRSMGASTSLIYASMDKRIKAVVADSPFTDFRRVAKEMCMAQVSIPGFLIEGAISIIGKSVFNKNKMKINEIKPIEAVKTCDIPVMFIHAKDDDMVNFQHTLDLYNNYRGINKEIKEVNGGHNGVRATFLMETIGKFFLKHLKNDEMINEEEKEPKEDIYENNNININITNDTQQKKGKTIYEAWGIPNPHIKKENKVPEKENKEDIKEKEINESYNNKMLNNNEIKNELKGEKKEEEIKLEKPEEKKEEIKQDVLKLEEIKKEKNELEKNVINLDINKRAELNFTKNFTFYNTNKNFDSYIDLCLNKNETNKNKETKVEEEEIKDNQINQKNEKEENNIINNYSNNPKRKTIYDDLNLRPQLKKNWN